MKRFTAEAKFRGEGFEYLSGSITPGNHGTLSPPSKIAIQKHSERIGPIMASPPKALGRGRSHGRGFFVCYLNDDYALMRDDLQWIIARRSPTDRLRPVKFTREGAQGVFRCLRQLGTQPDPTALSLIFEYVGGPEFA